VASQQIRGQGQGTVSMYSQAISVNKIWRLKTAGFFYKRYLLWAYISVTLCKQITKSFSGMCIIFYHFILTLADGENENEPLANFVDSDIFMYKNVRLDDIWDVRLGNGMQHVKGKFVGEWFVLVLPGGLAILSVSLFPHRPWRGSRSDKTPDITPCLPPRSLPYNLHPSPSIG